MRVFLGHLGVVVLGTVMATMPAEIRQGELQRHPAGEPGITLVLAGDVMLGRLVNETIHRRGPRYVWGDIVPLLRRPDFTFVNLECVIARGGKPFTPKRAFYFRADPPNARALVEGGIDGVALANNHALDFRQEGLLETISHLDRLGIAHCGAGKDTPEASAPAVVEVRDVKIGFVAFADHFREYAAAGKSAGINLITVSRDKGVLGRVEKAILSARREGADLVVFSIHWGPNMRERPTPEFIEFAHAVMDRGADIFHGHSAHIFQGIEIYRGKPILYDTGDLIDDYYVDPVLRNDRQLLFRLSLSSSRVTEIELIPIRIHEMQVNRATGIDFAAIRDRMVHLSKPFGTQIEVGDDRLWIAVGE
ncbi:MAG: CapA family protein [Fidelibacterota bacterium]